MHPVIKIGAVLLIALGLVALADLVCLLCNRPLIRLARVTGDSMTPTLLDGERVLFVRRGWQVGDIVLANVDGDAPVVKRILRVEAGELYLRGDNVAISETFWVKPEQLSGVMLFRCQLR